jgi:hypothetical protein
VTFLFVLQASTLIVFGQRRELQLHTFTPNNNTLLKPRSYTKMVEKCHFVTCLCSIPFDSSRGLQILHIYRQTHHIALLMMPKKRKTNNEVHRCEASGHGIIVVERNSKDLEMS